MASSGKSLHFTSMLHKDIHGYYLALRTFFEVTETKHDRSNSPRAQKARAKLLKLSSSQFYELSTDVYDELQRRINDDHTQPEYLLPKASFHIKRNQARQKLANLSQTRFNDLVDDILYEIKRRGYDSFGTENDDHLGQENNKEEALGSVSVDPSKPLVPTATAIQTSQVIPKKASIDWSSDEEEGTKSLKVDTDIDKLSSATENYPARHNFDANETPNNFNEQKETHLSLHSDSQQIATPVTKMVTENYQFMDSNSTPNGKETKEHDTETDASISHWKMDGKPSTDSPIKDAKIHLYHTPNAVDKLVQNSKMDKKSSADSPIEDTEKSPFHFSNESIEVDHSRTGGKSSINSATEVTKGHSYDIPNLANNSTQVPRLPQSSNHNTLTEDITKNTSCTVNEVSNDTDNLIIQNKLLKEQLEALNSKLKESEQEISSLRKKASIESHESNTSGPIISYQKELSSLSSQVSALSIENETLKQQVSEMGFRSKHSSYAKADHNVSNEPLHLLDKIGEKYPLDEKSISKFISDSSSVPFESVTRVNNLLIMLYTTLQLEKEEFGTELFENLSTLSNAIAELLVFVDTPEFRDEVILLKASLSHTITAVRYYSVFTTLLPKITVQAAISELAFSICNLIGSSKIKVKNTYEASNGKKEMNTMPSRAVGQSPQMDDLNHFKPGGILSISGDTADEMSPVKPLKITQRANMSPSSTASSSRKASGNLLFSMIDRKSPLSSAHSSKVNFKFSGLPSKVQQDDGKLAFANNDKSDISSGGKLSFESDTPNKPKNETASAGPNRPSVKTSPNTVDDKLDSLSNFSLNTPVDTPTKLKEKIDRELPSPSTASTAVPTKHAAEYQKEDNSIETFSAKSQSNLDMPSSTSRSFTDKLSSFTNGTGIGFRVDKEPKDSKRLINAPGASIEHPDKLIEKRGAILDTNTGHGSENPPLVSIAKNTSPSKLTDKLRKTFEHMSDDESDENKDNSTNNLSSSDDGETYLQLKKSLKKTETMIEPQNMDKITVSSSEARANDQSNNKDTATSKLYSAKLNTNPSFNTKNTSTRAINPDDSVSASSSIENEDGLSRSENQKALQHDPVAEENKINTVQEKQLPMDYSDDYSDYQFVPLKKETSGDLRTNVLAERKPEIDTVRIGPTRESDDNKGATEQSRDVDFDVDRFDIENPDNTLSELLLYLEHQTVEVISTIQSLLSSIKEPHATKRELRIESNAINQVINQMVEATSVSMNQSRNASLKEHGNWVVKSLEDCSLRMLTLCQLSSRGKVTEIKGDDEFADKNFKQRLAGIAFDVAKCTKELVKTVEEASLKEEIAYLNSHLN